MSWLVVFARYRESRAYGQCDDVNQPLQGSGAPG